MTPQEEGSPEEKACGERISYALERYGCALVPIIELRAGQVAARVDIVKIPPEILKQMKKAKKDGTDPFATAEASA